MDTNEGEFIRSEFAGPAGTRSRNQPQKLSGLSPCGFQAIQIALFEYLVVGHSLRQIAG